MALHESAEHLVSQAKCFQESGWECGLWVYKWAELKLRERRGEHRLPDLSIEYLLNRVNQFIVTVKDAWSKRDAENPVGDAC